MSRLLKGIDQSNIITNGRRARTQTRRSTTRRSATTSYGSDPTGTAPTARHFNTAAKPTQPLQNVAHINRTTTVQPEQILDHRFDPTVWANVAKPWNFKNQDWPPQDFETLLNTQFDPDETDNETTAMNHIGEYDPEDCLGRWAWQKKRYRGKLCKYDSGCLDHNFDEWKAGGQEWTSRFELRDVEDMGVGVFAIKRPFRRGDILGPYLGEFVPVESDNGDYTLRVELGPKFVPHEEHPRRFRQLEAGFLDAERFGNWTRFINHSCKSNCEFVSERVGNTRVMAVRAMKGIKVDQQITVNYGKEYFRNRQCFCGEANCVSGSGASSGTTKVTKTKKTKKKKANKKKTKNKKKGAAASSGSPTGVRKSSSNSPKPRTPKKDESSPKNDEKDSSSINPKRGRKKMDDGENADRPRHK